MDNELFELCYEVSTKTNLVMPKSTRNRWLLERGSHYGLVKIKPVAPPQYRIAPLYTSDYLLEKLPTKINDTSLVIETDGKIWWAHYLDENYIGGGKLYREADTPLKALLKLTLALHEAGELK
jgi:hypothetical protein